MRNPRKSFTLTTPGMANPFGILLIRQFAIGVSDDLFESARIDGCKEFRIFWQIFVPLCLPAISTLAVLHFINRRNNLFWPLIVTNTPEMRTVQLALTLECRSLYDIFWIQLCAGMTLALLPVLALYIFFQRYFTQGIALTGMKGWRAEKDRVNMRLDLVLQFAPRPHGLKVNGRPQRAHPGVTDSSFN